MYAIRSYYVNRLCYVNYIADVEEWCVLLRVPGMWRCLFPTRVDESYNFV